MNIFKKNKEINIEWLYSFKSENYNVYKTSQVYIKIYDNIK